MIKFVLDSDAAIKLAKAGVLEKLAVFAKCFMPKQAYQEVLRGKEKMYEDAFEIERIVENRKIKIINVKAQIMEGFGAGECAALSLFNKLGEDIVISDDRKFLSVLEKQGVPFIIPTDIIVMLAVKKQISSKEASEALDNMRSLVREENYKKAKEAIGGK